MPQSPYSAYSEKVMEHFRNPRNVGEIPNADGVGNVGNPVCLAPGALIHANNRIMEIENLKEGIRILSHDGRYHSVTKVYKRPYAGKLYSVSVHNLGKIRLTPEHHILALKTNAYRYKFRSYKRLTPDWYSAAELEKGDTLLYPIPGERKDVKYVKLDVERPRWDFKSRPLPEKIKVDERFMKLAGYYLAEGYVRTDRCKGTVGFVFGGREADYVNEIIFFMEEIFGLSSPARRDFHNSINVEFYSARLARFFEREFGKGAENKKVPQWVMLLPPRKQRALLCGLWRGDGYINSSGAKFVTISRQLAYSVRLLLLRQRIVFSFLTVPENGIHQESYCIYVKQDRSLKELAGILDTWIPSLKKKFEQRKSWYDDSYYYATIREIDSTNYSGDVYNLEVEGAHSYASSCATLHNCGDIMRLFIKVDNGVIADAKFLTFGCGAAVATSSMVTELVKGKTIAEALKISNRAVAEALGGLPPIKMHCSVLAEQALKSAILDYYKKRGETPPAEAQKMEHEEHPE